MHKGWQFRTGEGEEGGGGGGTPPQVDAWLGSLPDAVKEDAAVFDGFKGKPITDVLVAYRDATKSAAQNAPPADAKDYLAAMPQLPEGVTIDEEVTAGIFAAAHKGKISVAQMAPIMEHFASEAKNDSIREAKASADAKADLEKKWGDDYPKNVAAVDRFVKTLPADVLALVEKAGIASHPHFIQLIHTIGQAQSEGRLIGGDGGASKRSIEDRLYGAK